MLNTVALGWFATAGKIPSEKNASLWDAPDPEEYQRCVARTGDMHGNGLFSTRKGTDENQVFALSGRDARCLYDDHASGDHSLAVNTIIHCGL